MEEQPQLYHPPPPHTTDAPPPPPSHPSYAEMITAAIVWDSSQGKEGGSSKRAISKYIDRVYANLPPSHTSLLTHHLQRLKNSGHLIMSKNSYQLASPTPTPTPSHTGSIPIPSSPPAKLTPKRGPGRPSKPKPTQIPDQTQTQAQTNGSSQPTTARKRGRPSKQQQHHQVMMEPAEVPFVQPISHAEPEPSVPVPENGQSSQKRGRGRPSKRAHQSPVLVPVNSGSPGVVAKRRSGRPPKYNVGGRDPVPAPTPSVAIESSVGSRPRGRPRKNPLGPVSEPIGKRSPGRPPKMSGGSGAVAGVKRGRGRPPKGSVRPSPRKLSGKPLGRPRKVKDTEVWNHISEDSDPNEELKMKLERIQAKVRASVSIIKPYVANEGVPFAVLQELEELVTPSATAPPTTDPPSSGGGPPDLSMEGVTEPDMNAPAVSFSVNLPPMPVTAPPFPGGIDNQQAISWMPSSSEAKS